MFQRLCSTSTLEGSRAYAQHFQFYLFMCFRVSCTTQMFHNSCVPELLAQQKYKYSCAREILSQQKHQILMCSRAPRSTQNISSIMCFRAYSQHFQFIFSCVLELHAQHKYNSHVLQSFSLNTNINYSCVLELLAQHKTSHQLCALGSMPNTWNHIYIKHM